MFLRIRHGCSLSAFPNRFLTSFAFCISNGAIPATELYLKDLQATYVAPEKAFVAA
jgi:hypothetical protein